MKLFRKSIEQYHFSGFKVYPPCGFEIDDERLFPYYEICDNYRLPVLTLSQTACYNRQCNQKTHADNRQHGVEKQEGGNGYERHSAADEISDDV